MRFSLIIFIIVFVQNLSFSQEESKVFPIDKWVESCQDKVDSQAEKCKCIDEGASKWEKEMNQIYNSLIKKLRPVQVEILKKSQNVWLKFKSEQEKADVEIYSSLDGSGWSLVLADMRLKRIKARAIELKDMLDALSQDFE